jgi:dynein heavy chain 1
VSNIQRKHLDEIRALPKPPDKIRWTLEAVCMILSLQPVKLDWKEIRRRVAGSSFISEVANFDSKSITPEVRKVLI